MYGLTTGGAPGGKLFSRVLTTGTIYELADDVTLDGQPPSLNATKELVVQSNTPRDSTQLGTYALLPVNLAAEKASAPIGRGLGPSTSSSGDVAYCKSGRLVIQRVDPLGPVVTTPSGEGSSTGCVPIAWNNQGALAMVGPADLGTSVPGGSLALYIYLAGLQAKRIPLPTALYGASSLSWASDNERVAFESNGRIFDVDVKTGVATSLLAGSDPAYSPKDASLIASFDTSDTKSLFLVVSSGMAGKARIALPKSDSYALSWSPDGQWIAAALFTGRNIITLWNWRTGERRELTTAAVLPDYVILQPWILWAP